MTPNEAQQHVQAACAYISLDEAMCDLKPRGTGFLVSHSHLLTAWHVIEKDRDAVTVKFGASQTRGKVIHFNADYDFALLELHPPVPDIAPLTFSSIAPSVGEAWEAHGFPEYHGTSIDRIDGTVNIVNGRDQDGRPALNLYSPSAAAAQGAVLDGFSGSPLIVGGQVVGLLRRVLTRAIKQQPQRTELGRVYACPSAPLLEILREILPAAIQEDASERVLISAVQDCPEHEITLANRIFQHTAQDHSLEINRMPHRFIKTHYELLTLVEDLRRLGAFMAFEVFGPPHFGVERYLKELAQVLDEVPSHVGGPTAYKWLQYHIEDSEDPREAARGFLERNIQQPAPSERWRYVVVVYGIGSRSLRGSDVAGQALRGLDEVARRFEGRRDDGLSLAIILCTKRRQHGHNPLSELPHVDITLIESRIAYAAPVRLLYPEETVETISQSLASQRIERTRVMQVAHVCGGHPALMEASIALHAHEPLVPLHVLISYLYQRAVPSFKSLWDNTDQRERLLLIAAAIIQCSSLEQGYRAPALWSQGLARDGWQRLSERLGLFIDELQYLNILHLASDQPPSLFSTLFAVWLVKFAHAIQIRSSESLEDMLKATLEEQPTYLAALEKLWTPLYDHVREDGVRRLTNALLNGGIDTIASTIAGYLSR